MQNSTVELFGEDDAKQLKKDSDKIPRAQELPDININYQHNLAFLQTIEKSPDGTDSIKSPKLILDTTPFSYYINNETLANYLKKIVKPELITSLNASNSNGGHATSLYMKKDGSMIFFDPNAGEFTFKKDDFAGVAETFMRVMSEIKLTKNNFIGKRSVNFSSIVYSLSEGEKLKEEIKQFKELLRDEERFSYITNRDINLELSISTEILTKNNDNISVKSLASKLETMITKDSVIHLNFMHKNKPREFCIYKKNDELYFSIDGQTDKIVTGEDLLQHYGPNEHFSELKATVYSQAKDCETQHKVFKNLKEEIAQENSLKKELENTLKKELSVLAQITSNDVNRLSNKKSKNEKVTTKIKRLNESLEEIKAYEISPDKDKVAEMITKLTTAAKMKTGLSFGTTTYKNIKGAIKNINNINTR